MTVGSVAGTRPTFSPDDVHLSFRRPDGRPSLADLRTGLEWPWPHLDPAYRPLTPVIWSPDGDRLFLQAEATAGAKPSATPFLLYLYTVSSATLRQYSLAAPLNLRRYPVLLQAAQPEVEILLGVIPELENGPLIACSPSGYLAGRGERVVFLDPAARFTPWGEFPERVLDLSLAAGRRLIVVAGERARPRVYAWRLPRPDSPGGPFPDRRDLVLGALSLGLTTAQVQATLGPPPSQDERLDPIGGREKVRTYRYPEVAVSFIRGRLVRAVYSVPGAPTGRGIEVGSSLADVYERYGKPDYATSGYLSYQGQLGGSQVKVAFKLGSRRKIAAILISWTRGGGRIGRRDFGSAS